METASPSAAVGTHGVEMYRRMQLIRRFEERVVELVNANEIAGVTHEYVGEEAVAVGVCAALGKNDVITSTHRGHGHIIAKGGEVRYMFAELMGRESGYNRGRGGSMHLADVSLGILGANGIVGAGSPIACGAAYTFRRNGGGQVAVSFFGDGAVNQGVVHEALNLAAVWELPAVFVCENNGYAVTTPIGASSKKSPWERATAYGMPSVQVNGMDVQEVYEAAEQSVARARDGGGPSFIECRTYRYVGHQTAERLMKLSYRTETEIDEWRKRDPIESWASRLIEAGSWSAEARAGIDAAIEEELDEGIDFARACAWPDADTALDYMYASSYPGLPAKGWEA